MPSSEIIVPDFLRSKSDFSGTVFPEITLDPRIVVVSGMSVSCGCPEKGVCLESVQEFLWAINTWAFEFRDLKPTFAPDITGPNNDKG